MTQTYGIAKNADDPEMSWLDKFTAPTIANYFKEHGYQTKIKGKWHISDSEIKFKNGQTMDTYDNEGHRIPKLEDIYLEQNPLGDYGFMSSWIGPEPHGSSPLNSASSAPKPAISRDQNFMEQVDRRIESSGFEFDIDPTLPEKMFTLWRIKRNTIYSFFTQII